MLREVFAFDFPEIAAAVGRSEAACCQLAARARRHMDEGRPRFEADRRSQDELAARFFDALREGNLEGLQELLAADVQMVGDSGGKAPLWGRGVFGAEKVAQVLVSTIPWFVRIGGSFEPHVMNGQPRAIFRDRDGKVLNTWTLDVLDGQIQAIRTVLNPDKLGHRWRTPGRSSARRSRRAGQQTDPRLETRTQVDRLNESLAMQTSDS